MSALGFLCRLDDEKFVIHGSSRQLEGEKKVEREKETANREDFLNRDLLLGQLHAGPCALAKNLVEIVIVIANSGNSEKGSFARNNSGGGKSCVPSGGAGGGDGAVGDGWCRRG